MEIKKLKNIKEEINNLIKKYKNEDFNNIVPLYFTIESSECWNEDYAIFIMYPDPAFPFYNRESAAEFRYDFEQEIKALFDESEIEILFHRGCDEYEIIRRKN
jgi:hypothetical protein